MIAVAALIGAGAVVPASAQSRDGFYGGIAILERGAVRSGISMGPAVANGPLAATPDEGAARQSVFGGYRWPNDLSIEAALARSESYALRPLGAETPGGVGLMLGSRDESAARAAWNVDVVGSYTFLRTFALYGRVGYAQSEVAPAAVGNLLAGEVRRTREGVNYGLGLRYDVSRALGLNLEYTRFGRFAFESAGGTLPENDQVRLGLQLRF